MGYRFPEETMQGLLKDGKILFGEDHKKIVELKVYAHEFQDKLSSLIELDSRLGVYDLRQLFPEHKQIFTNPKPVRLIQHLASFVLQDGEIALDFFAGSGTTAQAVFALNREDEGNRRFIVIQLPEPTPETSPARVAGYATISEIGKERIRRVIQKLKQDNEGKLNLDTREKPEDLGFKVFKLTDSRFRQWNGVEERNAEVVEEQIGLFADPLVEGWQPLDVIYEIALKEGYSLSCRIEEEQVASNIIYSVADFERDQSFRICLDGQLSEDAIQALCLSRDDLFICRDKALSDTVAGNLALQCNFKVI
jgi:adenine-specific DNA-methyltransferase